MGLSIIFVTILFCFSYQNVENIMFYVMNICILFVIFYDCIASCLPRYSLPIYLYHVLGKLFAVYLFEEGTEGYHIVNILCFIAGCILVYFLRRIKIINNVIFGSTITSL